MARGVNGLHAVYTFKFDCDCVHRGFTPVGWFCRFGLGLGQNMNRCRLARVAALV